MLHLSIYPDIQFFTLVAKAKIFLGVLQAFTPNLFEKE